MYVGTELLKDGTELAYVRTVIVYKFVYSAGTGESFMMCGGPLGDVWWAN